MVILNIKRARRDRWLLGVSAGVAYSQGWSPGLTRLATAIIAIAIPGFSLVPVLLIYIVLGAVLPESEEF